MHRTLFILLILAAAPIIAPAISLYPIVYTTEYDDGTSVTPGTRELYAVGPFFYTRNSPEDKFWSLRPIVSRQYMKDTEKSRTAWIFPLGGGRTTPDNASETGRSIRKVSFMFIFQYEHWIDFDGFERKDFHIVPIWFSGRSEDGSFYYVLFPFLWYSNGISHSIPLPSLGPQTYKGVFPIYGSHYNTLLMDRIVYFLFPLYLYEQKGSMKGYSFLWPIFGFNKGDEYTSWRAWPLIGRASYTNGRNKWYFLWPLWHIWTKPTDPEVLKHDDVSAQILLPFFARVNSRHIWGWGIPFVYAAFNTPTIKSRGYFPPLLVYKEDSAKDYWEWNLLWIVGRIRRGAEHTQTKLWPLFSVSKEPDKRAWYFLWPFVHYNEQDFPDYKRSLFMIVPFFYKKKWEYTDGGKEITTYLIPFFKNEKLPDGGGVTNILWMFWYREMAAFDWNLAPLWTIFRSEQIAPKNVKEWGFLKPLLWSRTSGKGKVSEFNLLGLQYRNEYGTKRVGFLFRKLSFKLPF